MQENAPVKTGRLWVPRQQAMESGNQVKGAGRKAEAVLPAAFFRAKKERAEKGCILCPEKCKQERDRL